MKLCTDTSFSKYITTKVTFPFQSHNKAQFEPPEIGHVFIFLEIFSDYGSVDKTWWPKPNDSVKPKHFFVYHLFLLQVLLCGAHNIGWWWGQVIPACKNMKNYRFGASMYFFLNDRYHFLFFSKILFTSGKRLYVSSKSEHHDLSCHSAAPA